MISWLQRNRTSARVAFGLRLFVMGANGVLGLFWARVLLHTLGNSLMGQFLAFQAVANLGGLGDLGMGGAVALRAGQMLGSGDEPRLRTFLANARLLFLSLAIAAFVVFLSLSDFLPGWLRFDPVAGAGSYHLLFALGAVSAGFIILNSYFLNVNYAHGTVVWPIVPLFLVTQFSLACHWCLAHAGYPLWVQYLPYLAMMPVVTILGKFMLDWSHPWLGNLFPVRIDWAAWRALFWASGWVYLSGLGNMIYTTTDRLVVNAFFGAGRVPAYQYNYKLCELSVILVTAAAFVGMPKITQWLASGNPDDRARAVREATRLNQFQIVAGCAASLVYLAINNVFVRLWLGAEYQMPIALQAAFALNLAITASADACIQVAGRFGRNGIRAAGLAIGATGVVNLILSLICGYQGYLVGVAIATVIAQSLLSVVLTVYMCRHLGAPAMRWIGRNWLMPVLALGVAIALRYWLPGESAGNILLLLGCYAVLLIGLVMGVGINAEMVRAEMAVVKGILGRK